MKKIFFLLISFFILSHFFSSLTFAAGSCSITFDPSKPDDIFTTTEGITIRVSGVSKGTAIPFSDKDHRVVILDSNDKEIKSFDNSTDSFKTRIVIGNFSKGSYTINVTDRDIPGNIGEKTLCTTSFSTKPVIAAGDSKNMTLTVDKEVAYRNPVTVVLSNIPKTTAPSSHNLILKSSANGSANMGSLRIDIDGEDCSVSNETSDMFTSASTPVCDNSGGGFLLSATIDTTKLNISPDDITSHSYTLSLPTSGSNVGSSFTVQPPTSGGSFTIESISPETAKPGDTITITIKGAKPDGKYSFGIRGPFSSPKTDVCKQSDCTLTFLLSDAITSDKAEVFVLGPDGTTQTKTLTITLLTPMVSVVSIVPTTPPDVPLPCAEVDRDNFGGCKFVHTGIPGISIPTNASAFITFIFGILLSVSGGIALMLIIFSGYQIMTSEGNPEKIQGARDTITSAIIGLVFMIFSLVLLKIIGVDILHIPGFS